MSEDNPSTRFYKVFSHENNGEQTIQFAAWGNSAAALFSLGDPHSNGYIDSDPNAQPDETSPRAVTVLYLFKNVRHQAELQTHLEQILNPGFFMDELADRPPIGDVDLSRFPADQMLLAGLFA